MVVVSISAWDGYRILGVFQSKEKAEKAVEELKISNVGTVSYDIVEVGKISYSHSYSHPYVYVLGFLRDGP